MDIRYAFLYNDGNYDGGVMRDKVEDINRADLTIDYFPSKWIDMELKEVGKIIEVEVTIRRVSK